MMDTFRYHITDIPSEKCFIKPPYQRNSTFLCMLCLLIPDAGRRRSSACSSQTDVVKRVRLSPSLIDDADHRASLTASDCHRRADDDWIITRSKHQRHMELT